MVKFRHRTKLVKRTVEQLLLFVEMSILTEFELDFDGFLEISEFCILSFEFGISELIL